MSHRQPRAIRPSGRRLARQGIAGIVVAALLTLVGVSAAVADSTGQVDVSNTVFGGADAFTSSAPWGQTFIPNVSGQITKLDIATGMYAQTTPVQTPVEIRAVVADGQLSDQVIASGTLSSAGSNWFPVSLTSQGTLTAGKQYAIVFRKPLQFTYNDNAYAGGNLIIPTGDDTYRSDTSKDLRFQTYMTQPQASISGTPPTGVLTGYAYSYAYTVTGTPTPTVALVDGTLPDGLSLSADGVLSGTPRAAGTSTFTVQASNGSATATLRSTITVRNPQPPSAPSASASAGDQSAVVRWDPPVNPGDDPVTGYTVTASPGGATYSAGGDARGMSISGLTPGTAYTFTVTASSAAGSGPASAATNAVTPYTRPDAPGAFTATPRDTTADLTWMAPADGYSPITSYVVTARSTNGTVKQTVAPDATSTTITGLTNGVQYVFYVAAVNAAGTGPAASSQPATPIGYPTAPDLVSATGGDGSLTLSWKPPTDDGGSAVTSYVAQISTATSDWAKVALSDNGTITGLTNGTEYSVRIAAVNAAGRGTWSNTLTANPIATPDTPTAVTVVPDDGSVTVAWQPPADDGGSPITGYRVIYRAQTAATGGWTPSNDIVNAAPVTVTGLQNGTAYQFRVVALNAAGAGVASSPVSSTPFVFTPTATTDGAPVTGRTLAAGDVVHLHATNLPADSSVLVQLHSTVTTLATVPVGDDGTLDEDVTIPAGAAPGAHELTLTLTGTGAEPAEQSFAITVARGATPTPTATPTAAATSTPTAAATDAPIAPVSEHTPAGQLAFTGSTISILAVAGAVLATLIGALILFWRHRHRRPRRP